MIGILLVDEDVDAGKNVNVSAFAKSGELERWLIRKSNSEMGQVNSDAYIQARFTAEAGKMKIRKSDSAWHLRSWQPRLGTWDTIKITKVHTRDLTFFQLPSPPISLSITLHHILMCASSSVQCSPRFC